MYLYWRVQQDLNDMGKALLFRHPNFIRAFEQWVKKNAGGLAMAENLTVGDIVATEPSLN